MGDTQLETGIESSAPSSIEKELVILAQKGDESAFGELYDIWAAKVYRFTYVKVKDAPTAEDLTSDIFLKAWQKIHQYQPQGGVTFGQWLYTVARNTVIDYYRTAKNTEISFEDLAETASLEGDEAVAEVGELEAALSSLPADYEKVLRLRFVEQLPIARVAQIMKKKEDNIRAITSRALKKLKDVLSHS